MLELLLASLGPVTGLRTGEAPGNDGSTLDLTRKWRCWLRSSQFLTILNDASEEAAADNPLLRSSLRLSRDRNAFGPRLAHNLEQTTEERRG
jgi:hypothetical protein